MAWSWALTDRRVKSLVSDGVVQSVTGPHNSRHHFHGQARPAIRRRVLLERYPKLRDLYGYILTHEGETISELIHELRNTRGLSRGQFLWRLNRLQNWGFVARVPKAPAQPEDKRWGVATGGRVGVVVVYAYDERKPRLRTFEQRRKLLADRVALIDWEQD